MKPSATTLNSHGTLRGIAAFTRQRAIAAMPTVRLASWVRFIERNARACRHRDCICLVMRRELDQRAAFAAAKFGLRLSRDLRPANMRGAYGLTR